MEEEEEEEEEKRIEVEYGLWSYYQVVWTPRTA